AAIVYNYKHKTHVAGEPAVPISRCYDWEPVFFVTVNESQNSTFDLVKLSNPELVDFFADFLN
ncbi:MAG: hypothetical protein IJT42_06770, partial [Treponema sp.]|nr:hypothetical protein [Treponema sp.]